MGRCSRMHTGQMEIDAIVAALILATIFLFSATLQYVLTDTFVMYARYQSILLDALRYSDFLLYSPDGLAITHAGLTLDHIVDCSRVPMAYALLEKKGFNGYITCGSYTEGKKDVDFVVRRRAVWVLAGVPIPVTVEVGVRASHS